MMRALPLLLLPLAGVAHAEGARLVLDCQVVTACDAAGACAPAEDAIRFTVEPESIDDEGIGLFSIWIDDAAEAHLARGLSRTGPFLWSADDSTRETLVLTGETTALHTRQNLGGTPPARIDLLTCEVTF